jgi:hypothetical protein
MPAWVPVLPRAARGMDAKELIKVTKAAVRDVLNHERQLAGHKPLNVVRGPMPQDQIFPQWSDMSHCEDQA